MFRREILKRVNHRLFHSTVKNEEIPWFPQNISQLDVYCNRVLEAGIDLQSDHPGFNDINYRKRRVWIAQIAKNFKHGQSIPRLQYTKEEKETWAAVYNMMRTLFPEYACQQVNQLFPLLIERCGYGEDDIPQLQDVSQFLQQITGFQLRPVAGFLSQRDFLNGLAFRVFHCTQYIRHHSEPLYTPEPDAIHELLGHIPLFADAQFAELSQEIGLASLGASDEVIKKLGSLYLATMEFGMCQENGHRKAYGAGLLSSYGELEYSMSDTPEIRPFIPEKACTHEFQFTEYQPLYFLSESIEIAKIQTKHFISKLSQSCDKKPVLS